MIRFYCNVCDNEITHENPLADNSVTELKLPTGGSLKITISTTSKDIVHVCTSCLAKHIKSYDVRPSKSHKFKGVSE